MSKAPDSSSAAGWFQGLQEHIQKCREALPITDREALSAVEETQCQIVGGSLIRWLQDTGPQFLGERRVLAKMMKVSPDPDIVFTSNMPGLVAAAEILGDDHEGIAYLLEDEYAQWIAQSTGQTLGGRLLRWSQPLDESGNRHYVTHALALKRSPRIPEISWYFSGATCI